MDVEHRLSEEQRKNGCPLGQSCDKCNWYKPMYREEPGKVIQSWDCNLNNLVRLTSEQKMGTKGVQEAVESFRNEVVEAEGRVVQIAGPKPEALIGGN